MEIITDTHVHFYDSYDLKYFFDTAFWNLTAYGEGSVGVLFFTQSSKNSPTFDDLVARLKDTPGFNIRIEEGFVEVLTANFKECLFLIPGCQFVSSEKIEVLALAYDSEGLDGLGVEEIINKINLEGGQAVLPWSPGKWRKSRGEKLTAIIEQKGKFSFALGDIAMRACGYPKLFNRAKEKQIKIFAGSDSLPLPGEERLIFKYANAFEVPDNFVLNAKSFTTMLNDVPFIQVGRRNSLIQALKRWVKLYRKK